MSVLRQLLALFWLDLRQAFHGRLLHVSLGTAIVFGLLLRFALPSELDGRHALKIADLTEDARFRQLIEKKAQGGELEAYGSFDDLEAAVEADGEAIGIALRGTVAAPAATLVLQGHESPSTVVGLRSGIAGLWVANGLTRPSAHRMMVLRPEHVQPPFNLSMIPMLITVDVIVLGFFFGGVMVLQDRALGTVRVYRVSPAGTGVYLAAKIAVNVLLALAYTALLLMIVIPPALPVVSLMLVIVLASALLTTVGVGLAVFFRTFSSFFYPASLVSLVLSAAMPAYFFPAFNTPWIRALPTYKSMFILRELLLPSGRPSMLAEYCLSIGAALLVALVLTYLALDRRLLREA